MTRFAIVLLGSLALVTPAHATTARGDVFVTKEKGRLVLYEGKKRTARPASTFLIKDDGQRWGVVIEE